LEKRKAEQQQKRGARLVLSQIVEADEGGKDEDDNARLSELIALAEAGLLAQDKQPKEDAADEAEDTYFKRQAVHANVGEPNRRNEVVVEDWDSNDELLFKGGDD
jgi:hypothetical protein